jgi:hydrogenase maturation protease
VRAGDAGAPVAGTRDAGTPGAGTRADLSRVLVVGYGNALRGDDALGWHAVARLAADSRLDGARVTWQHQLTPELAHDIAGSSLVVLVDAESGSVPGTLAVRRIEPDPQGDAALSHHVSPESLLVLAGELYGSVPATWMVSVGVAGLDVGAALSPEVEAAIPSVVDAVAGIVLGHPDA